MRYLFCFPLLKEINDFAVTQLPDNKPDDVAGDNIGEPNYYQTAAQLKNLGFAARIEQYDPWTGDEALNHLVKNIFSFR